MTAEILVVDDNPANLASIRAVLDGSGAESAVTQSGDEALRALLSRDFALILLDIQMPSLDGYETARLIRSRQRSRHTPIIFLTAFERSESNVLEGYALGAVDFLFKPLVPEILLSKVGVFLDLHRNRLETRRQAELLRQAERREHARVLDEARQRYERALLKEEMKRERKVGEALSAKAEDLTSLVREKEEAQQALHRGNLRLQLLADSANELLLGPDPHARVADLCRRFCFHLELDVHLRFWIGDEPDAELTLEGAHGVDPDAAHALVAREPEGPLWESAAGRRRVVQDANTPLRGCLATLGLAALATFPVVSQGRLLGLLAFGSTAPRAFAQDELAAIQVLCDQIAVAIERAALIVELRDSDKRKDEFLAMLGHELRNPLAPIRNALEVVRLRAAEDELLVRALDAADRQVHHITRLVDDLLDVSRITRGKVELRRQRVELSEVLEQALHACAPNLEQREHRLHVRMPARSAPVDADPSRLTQIFANLVQNASKYTEPGGEIWVEACAEDGEAVVRVRDSGIGIRPALLGSIFELFVQVDPTSDRAQGGLGLGLTLVKSLVELHGGTVRAHSEGVGLGAEFTVRLPLASADGKQPRTNGVHPEAPSGQLSRTLRILLVEDNPDIRSTMRDLLELYGHQVEEAADGVLGAELLLAQRPHVALVDIGLPGIDGYRVAELVRASAGGAAGTRLVALTGYGGQEDRRRALAAGFDAHLVKPVSAQDLKHLLDQIC